MSRELTVNHPEIHNYCTIWMENITYVTAKGSSGIGLTNTNKLIRQYEYATGLKTGSTSLAKYCVSATAEKRRSGTDRRRHGSARLQSALCRCHHAFKLRIRKMPPVHRMKTRTLCPIFL